MIYYKIGKPEYIRAIYLWLSVRKASFSTDNKMWECRTIDSIHDKDSLDRTRVEIKAFIPHKGFVQKHRNRISSLVIRLEKEKAISNNTYMKEWRLEFVAISNSEIDRIMRKGKDNSVMWVDLYNRVG